MKNFMMCQFVHDETFVFHEHSELESSTSLPGGNLVDGLPPVVNNLDVPQKTPGCSAKQHFSLNDFLILT